MIAVISGLQWAL